MARGRERYPFGSFFSEIHSGGWFSRSPWDLGFQTFVIPQPGIAELRELIRAIAVLDISAGVSRSLSTKVEAALAQVEEDRVAPAVNTLWAFINEVRAQSGKELTEAEAAALEAAALDIISLLAP